MRKSLLATLAAVASLTAATSLTAAAPAAAATRGIWLSQAEVAALPMSGPAWQRLKATADADLGSAAVSDHNSLHDTSTLAVALVAARTGDPRYRAKAADAIVSAIGTEQGPLVSGSRLLPISRNATSYVIAADLIDLAGYDAAKAASFRTWIGELRTLPYDGDSLTAAHEGLATNHGTMAGAARAAIAAYLGDTATLTRVARVFRGWLGDRSSHVFSRYPPGSETFMPDPAQARPVNPAGSVKGGHDVDGVLPAEWARCGAFQWPPCYTDYAWGGLSGAVVQAELLRRSGHDAFQWEAQALRRAYQRLSEQAQDDPVWWDEATHGDDSWQPWLANFAYGTSFAAVSPTRPGKNMGWTDWTHAGRRAGGALAPQPQAPAPLPPAPAPTPSPPAPEGPTPTAPSEQPPTGGVPPIPALIDPIASPSATVVRVGRLAGGTAANLARDDGRLYEVASTGGPIHATSWQAVFRDIPEAVRRLDVTYRGRASQECTLRIAIWRAADSTWVSLATRAVGPAERSVVDLTPPGRLSDYVSDGGGLRLRLACRSGESTFVSSADLLRVAYAT